jgi:hypothetical protein
VLLCSFLFGLLLAGWLVVGWWALIYACFAFEMVGRLEEMCARVLSVVWLLAMGMMGFELPERPLGHYDYNCHPHRPSKV